MNEIWVEVEGHEGYEVSNTGKVMSYKRKEPKLLKNRLTFDGYEYVTLINGKVYKDYRVHRLVAKAFIPNAENKETVNHIDGDKRNNNVDNLEWATRTEQNLHSYRLGLKKAILGHENTNSKLSPEQVREIRKLYIKGDKEFGAMNLARMFCVNGTTIENIVKGRTYKNVQ
jgi:hypothetical protein